ncbi:hypothetical protein BpHYR1_020060 [Brachionus plicatilis]|uniref:Uncharacterized protein n=1 Tax=Brachionus plicatilis TaxID=10195 RepID=A0A3M7QY04_BRAPC|nr:hypothetical protein BpHYR1_020060 [Brachionus plicatilis]
MNVEAGLEAVKGWSVDYRGREVVPGSLFSPGSWIVGQKAFFVTPDCVGWAVAGDGRHKFG